MYVLEDLSKFFRRSFYRLKQRNLLRIIAFDPGGKMGWAIIEIHLKTGKIDVIKIGTLDSARVGNLAATRTEVNVYDKKVITYGYMKQAVNQLIKTYAPVMSACEDAYLNPRQFTAYAALKIRIHVLASFLYDNYRIPMEVIKSSSAKKAVSEHGNANKVNVQEAVKDHPRINLKIEQSAVEGMTEHEADAIAVGFYFAESIVPLLDLEEIVHTILNFMDPVITRLHLSKRKKKK